MNTESLLIELGTEELPPKLLSKLSVAFSTQILNGLREAELLNGEQKPSVTSFATPRRLGVLVDEVLAAQPDQTIERRGPAVQAAFDEQGEPTPAATGFAKSCGVEVADLARLANDKGEWLSFTQQQPGKVIADLIPSVLEQAIKKLPIAKRMRWGNGQAEFVRPVHWLIVMHGSRVLPASILGVESANTSRGHRFHSEGLLTIDHAKNYQSILLEQGHVVASFSQRQELIVEQVKALAGSINARIENDPALLDEVTGLVEQPTAILGSFAQEFLAVPQECLISSMRDHQKYFHLLDKNDKLLPHFITVSNIQSKDPKRVIQGNERVLRARLSDAQFFWQTDQKLKLKSRVTQLKNVLFHAKLGSVFDKSKRIESLAGKIAKTMGADSGIAERGALLAKADLVSAMVNEFDDLQGIMGRYYADLDGEPKPVGECIEQHYWPKFAGDQLPQSMEAQAVALADKLDTLVGLYSAGEIPTGDKDPYGLRRNALSILRILIEQQHTNDLVDLVSMSASVYAEQQEFKIASDSQEQIVDFIRGRLTAFYQNQNIGTTVINAVMACKPTSPLDFERRVKAINQFSQLAEANDLAAANKRIRNILKKQKGEVSDAVQADTLVEPAEIQLHKAIETLEKDCLALFAVGDYQPGLKKLATLRSVVDEFFEQVMVMSEDAQQQRNRLALLKRLQHLFLGVADISLLS